MDIIKELEAMRKRMIQEINTEFDLLIERAQSEGMTVQPPVADMPYETFYSLTSGTTIFKGTKPATVILPDRKQIHVNTWKQVAEEIMKYCIADEKNKKKLYELSNHISGRKRILLGKTTETMRSPLMLCKDLYMETHYDTETLLNVLTIRILGAIQFDYSDIQVSIRNR